MARFDPAWLDEQYDNRARIPEHPQTFELWYQASVPAQLVKAALAISGVFDLEPLRHTPFLQGDLRLTPGAVRKLSPAYFPRPKGILHAAVGADESAESLRQNALIQQAWGRGTVPVCDTVPQTNHFEVLHELADPSARLHAMARELLGLNPR